MIMSMSNIGPIYSGQLVEEVIRRVSRKFSLRFRLKHDSCVNIVAAGDRLFQMCALCSNNRKYPVVDSLISTSDTR